MSFYDLYRDGTGDMEYEVRRVSRLGKRARIEVRRTCLAMTGGRILRALVGWKSKVRRTSVEYS
jgi:hypothetical protein